MGCCASAQRNSHSSPYISSPTTQAADSSRAHIPSHPSSPPSHSIISHADTPRHSQHHDQHHAPVSPLSRTPNTPIRAPAPSRSARVKTPHGARWSRERLQREREAFFETRVSGSEEMWGVVKMVVQLVREGDVGEAQGILDAAGCTCPSGELNKGIFDERGQFYQVPEWVIVDPGDLVEGEGEDDESEEEDDGKEIHDVDIEGLGAKEKGKGRALDVGEKMKVRARLSDRGTDVIVQVGSEEHVRAMIRGIREVAGIPHSQKLKIAYLGRILHEHGSLKAQGWREGHVVNVLVFQRL